MTLPTQLIIQISLTLMTTPSFQTFIHKQPIMIIAAHPKPIFICKTIQIISKCALKHF